ncbi:retron St85 family RNA-directed DNA polymerase [Ferriphaselus sp. R-1]|uniref:retron St85 family RNA-directed DNA polymerase n=1 Tax=Ferriphaselus sp. R-1 TaxID=1485544 RepID=UPI0009DFEBED|nr:retron St85 family RNA-directed DNA polymerase [Ferriphaselus sp. R-1]
MGLIERIQQDFTLTRREVQLLLLTAASRYKLHYIEKRHGRGRRLIAQPTAEIKILQKWAVANYVNLLPIHNAATAYRPGRSIKDHAVAHAGNRYLLKLDFENFFPSITGNNFFDHLKSYLEVSDEDANLLVRLLFRYELVSRNYVLSIGAPSSPAVSNTIMFKFDTALAEYCDANQIAYTRYADDLALSTNTPKVLNDAYNFVRQLCRETQYPRVSLNEKKTVFVSNKFRRELTGLVLSNEGRPSLGREKKRQIRSMAHHFSLGQIPPEDVPHLRGLIAFAISIEPEFIESIKRMISIELFQSLMSGQA